MNSRSGSPQPPLHTIGIPLIVVSIAGFALAVALPDVWKIATALFVVGWIFQFVGHAFEGRPPEYFKDWRFLIRRPALVTRQDARPRVATATRDDRPGTELAVTLSANEEERGVGAGVRLGLRFGERIAH